jgi:hypothetical protein
VVYKMTKMFQDNFNRGEGIVTEKDNFYYLEFEDSYEHLDDNIEYILESVLQENDGTLEFQQLKDFYNSKLENYCKCLNHRDENTAVPSTYRYRTVPYRKVSIPKNRYTGIFEYIRYPK